MGNMLNSITSGITSLVLATSMSAAPVKQKRFSYPYANLGAPQLSVYEVNNIPQIKNLNIGYDKTVRCLRWQDITKTVENTYNLPPNILLGIMANETGGNLLLPNLGNNFFYYASYARKTTHEKRQKEIPVVAEKLVGIGEEYFPRTKPAEEIIDAMFSDGDAGLGAFQQQNSTAAQYGLSRVTESKKLIDRTQAKVIGRKLYNKKFDIKYLALEDDRWHLVKTADAAGRMLADYYNQSRSNSEAEKWDYALYRYSGRHTYSAKVKQFMKLLGNKEHILTTARNFEKRNKNATIDGAPLTFDKYCWFYNSYAASMFDLPGYLDNTRKYVAANLSSGTLPAIGMREQIQSRAALTLTEDKIETLPEVFVERNNSKLEKIHKTPIVEKKQKATKVAKLETPKKQKKKKQVPNITPFVTLENIIASNNIDPNSNSEEILPTNISYLKPIAQAPIIDKPLDAMVQKVIAVAEIPKSISTSQHTWYPVYSDNKDIVVASAPHSKNYGHFTTPKGFNELMQIKDADDISVNEDIEYLDRSVNKRVLEMFRAA